MYIVQTFFKECIERIYTFNVSISNGSKEEFKQHIYCKNWFSDRVFIMLSLIMLTKLEVFPYIIW